MRAREIMTTPVVSVHPETLLKEAAEILASHRISGAPVVDHLGRLIGVVSESDIIRSMTQEPGHHSLVHLFLRKPAAGGPEVLRVSDLMTTATVTAGVDTTVREIAHLMAAHDVNRVPIVSENRVVGIVTRADLVRALTRHDEAITDEIQWRLTHDLWIDTRAMAIRTQNGGVSLAGEVESYTDARLAERCALATDGVIGVDASGLRYRFDDRRGADSTDPRRDDPTGGSRWP